MEKKALLTWIIWGALFVYVGLYVCTYFFYNTVIDYLHSSYSIVSVSAIVLPYGFLILFLIFIWKSGYVQIGKRIKIFLCTFGILALVPVGSLIEKLGVHESHFVFNKDKWISQHEMRVYMVDDLLAKYSLKGRPKNDIVKLLGNPTETAYFKEPNNIVYWLGNERGLVRIDSEWLVIWFDSENKVMKYEIMRD